MNIDDLKKGLECCLKPPIGYCRQCPYNNNVVLDCNLDEMVKDALNIINGLKRENELLRNLRNDQK